MGPENNVRLGGCQITECLLPYFNMVTALHEMVGLERMLDYRGVGLERFHCIYYYISMLLTYIYIYIIYVNNMHMADAKSVRNLSAIFR